MSLVVFLGLTTILAICAILLIASIVLWPLMQLGPYRRRKKAGRTLSDNSISTQLED